MKFFCSQCRKDYKIDSYVEFPTKSGRRMGKASCPVCGLQLFRRLDTDYQIETDQQKKTG